MIATVLPLAETLLQRTALRKQASIPQGCGGKREPPMIVPMIAGECATRCRTGTEKDKKIGAKKSRPQTDGLVYTERIRDGEREILAEVTIRWLQL